MFYNNLLLKYHLEILNFHNLIKFLNDLKISFNLKKNYIWGEEFLGRKFVLKILVFKLLFKITHKRLFYSKQYLTLSNLKKKYFFFTQFHYF